MIAFRRLVAALLPFGEYPLSVGGRRRLGLNWLQP